MRGLSAKLTGGENRLAVSCCTEIVETVTFSLPPALRATSLIRGRLWGGAKSQIAQYTERCIEVRPYLFDKPGFNVLTFLSLTRKTLEKDLLAVKHSGRLNERSLCLSKELFPDSESPV